MDRRLASIKPGFWLESVEKPSPAIPFHVAQALLPVPLDTYVAQPPSPAMFEAVIWALQTKTEYTLPYFLFSRNKKNLRPSACRCKHASG
jgi:hypothetical protein